MYHAEMLPISGARVSVALSPLLGELGSKTKVANLDGALGGEKNVVALDISMDAMEGVNVVQSIQYLHVEHNSKPFDIIRYIDTHIPHDPTDLQLRQRQVIVKGEQLFERTA